MVTGAARAEVAFLVIDAEEGIQENSKRHGYLLSMLGIRQICVLVNKMDLVDYDRTVYRRIVRRYRRFLRNLDISATSFIPVSGRDGTNVTELSDYTPWYTGSTVVDQLDLFEKEPPHHELPFRMPVQDIYKFTRLGDKRRIVAGSIETGTVSVGDEVVFYPSGKKSRVKTIEAFNRATPARVSSPSAVGFTLDEQIYIKRGEVATKRREKAPLVAREVRVSIFWLGREDLDPAREYIFKSGTCRRTMRIAEVIRVINASNLRARRKQNVIHQHEVAECILRFDSEIAFDPVDENPSTSRFVIVDNYEIAGGGIVREAVQDSEQWVRENVRLRNFNWQRSCISPARRAERYNQRSTFVIITGNEAERKRHLAEKLEERLFSDGKYVYCLGLENMLHGVSADIDGERDAREEHIRRMAEVAHLFLDAGAILIASVPELTQNDLELIRLTVNPDTIEVFWVGDETTTDIDYDLKLPYVNDHAELIDEMKLILKRNGVFYSYAD
jgi:bifunctional enzyme CysN/CysC